AAIAESDGFIITAAEYNFGPAAVLKNAIDWVYQEWRRKAVAFVSWGSQGGTRSVQQLREISVELQLAAIKSAVHIPLPVLMQHFQGQDVAPGLAELDQPANVMIDDLLWWTNTLKDGRANDLPKATAA